MIVYLVVVWLVSCWCLIVSVVIDFVCCVVLALFVVGGVTMYLLGYWFGVLIYCCLFGFG